MCKGDWSVISWYLSLLNELAPSCCSQLGTKAVYTTYPGVCECVCCDPMCVSPSICRCVLASYSVVYLSISSVPGCSGCLYEIKGSKVG